MVAAAADLVGVASAALHRSVEHAKTRRQFGTPIGAFQGIKHALADNYVSVERARSLTYAAAARLGRSEPPTPAAAWTAAALAKAAAGDAATSCARTAVQVHGALGADLGARHRTSTSGTPGRARRCWATVARCTTRWAAGSREAPA